MQSNGFFKREKGCFIINFTVPEVKILILLSYFLVFGIVSLVNISITINEANAFLDDLFKYFACQLGGYNPKCEEFRQQFEKHLKPGLNGANYALIGLITWVHILIATKAQDYKWLRQKAASCYHYLINKVSVNKTPTISCEATCSTTKRSFFSKSSPNI